MSEEKKYFQELWRLIKEGNYTNPMHTWNHSKANPIDLVAHMNGEAELAKPNGVLKRLRISRPDVLRPITMSKNIYSQGKLGFTAAKAASESRTMGLLKGLGSAKSVSSMASLLPILIATGLIGRSIAHRKPTYSNTPYDR